MSALEFRDVSVRYPGADVATPAGTNFAVSSGELVLVLGPSGCGKSTLALTSNGLIPQVIGAAMSGAVLIDGEANSVPVAERATRLGLIMQDADAQIVTRKVFDEVCFGPENLALPIEEVESRARAALETVGLWQQREASPDELSGGERQRLLIACALALRPPVLVLDEPTANLDPIGQRTVYSVLGQLAREGHAVVVIDHNLDAALTVVTRVVVLDHSGRVVLDGKPTQLRERIEEVAALGVWLPTALRAGLRLGGMGVALEPLPMNASELRGALEQSSAAWPLPNLPLEREHPVGEPLIRIERVHLQRGGNAVLRDVSLDICRGDFVAISGPNGAGKSSLLHAVAGLLPLSSGSIAIAGRDPRALRPRELAKTLGFVFQNPEHQFVTTSVRDEIALSIPGRRDAAAEAQLRELLERLDLAALTERHPFTLSGGQKRRLSVATALAAGAEILLLDEPTFGQDRQRAEELMALLTELNETGTTIVLVSHDVQLVADYAHRGVLMSRGSLIDSGSLSELVERGAFAEADIALPPLAEATRGLSRGWSNLQRLSQLRRRQ